MTEGYKLYAIWIGNYCKGMFTKITSPVGYMQLSHFLPVFN